MHAIFLRPIVVFAALLALSLGANAGQPFDAKAFQEAQSSGKTILLDVAASWCPVCKQQRPIIESIEKERPNLIVFVIDFDTGKEVLKRLGAQAHSTLIVFKGPKEVGRSSGETDPASIRALVAKGF